MEELFHICNYDYQLGETVNAPDLTHYAQLAINQNQGWVDEFLDAHKPENAPSRRQTLFAFDKPQACVAFNKTGRFLYKVEMEDPFKVPFCLVNFINENGPNPLVAAEYWSPNHHWMLFEYLHAEMTIVARIEITRQLRWNNILNNLADDRQLATQIFL